MDYELNGKIVLITGANNPMGIGAATAIKFAQEGAKVVMVYKKIQSSYDENNTNVNGMDLYLKMNAGDCLLVEKKIKNITDDYLILEADITKSAEVKDVFDKIENKFGSVQVLVNNAAVADETSEKDTIFTVTEDVIDNTFGVNVKGTLFMTREFVRRFKKNKLNYGRVINLSTDVATRVFAGQITYGASKAAVEALTKSVAAEIGSLGITVNTVAPGPIQTGWIDEDLEKSVLPSIPLGRLGTPEDIADTILFLSSARAAWVTGQVIRTCGGHVTAL
ncbi:3-ketoacyl-ACP reductase [Spirochaetia bacterium]|nr:3-ketoacyl-ACP reductase [Spirochaetia bacterium]